MCISTMHRTENVYPYTCTEQKTPHNSEVLRWLLASKYSVRNLLHATHLAPGNWKWLLDFGKICGLVAWNIFLSVLCNFYLSPINVLGRYTRCRGRHACVIMPACDCFKISVLTDPRRTEKYMYFFNYRLSSCCMRTVRASRRLGIFKLKDQCLQPVVQCL